MDDVLGKYNASAKCELDIHIHCKIMICWKLRKKDRQSKTMQEKAMRSGAYTTKCPLVFSKKINVYSCKGVEVSVIGIIQSYWAEVRWFKHYSWTMKIICHMFFPCCMWIIWLDPPKGVIQFVAYIPPKSILNDRIHKICRIKVW